MPTLDDRLLPVLIRQHWLVTTTDVLEAGGTRDQVAQRVRTGAWMRVDRGVYRPALAPETWEAAHLAPILGARPHARVLASDLSAAALHGIPGFARGRPELSTPKGYNLRRPGVRIRISTDLARCNAVTIDGVPTTSLPRTLLDLGRTVGDRRLLRAIEWARRERGVTWADLTSTLVRHARRGRGGIRRLRRVILANAHREEIADSGLELLLLSILREYGLPEPVLHHPVHDGGRFVAEVDAAYPEHRVAIEVDGRVHLEEDVWQRDQPRQNDLILLGWTVLRFTWERMQDRPHLVASEVRAALASTARRTVA